VADWQLMLLHLTLYGFCLKVNNELEFVFGMRHQIDASLL
jgi:hypothetical protein